MNNRRFTIAVLSVLSSVAVLFASCEEMIEFDPGEVDAQAVLLSRPESDSLLYVNMTWSRFFLDGHTPPSIDDAVVMLGLNGTNSVATLDSKGRYRFNVTPQPGDSMTLVAMVPGYSKQLKASTVMPPTPQVEVLEYIIDTTYKYQYYEFFYRLRVKVTDPDNDGYYALNVLNADKMVTYNDSLYWVVDSAWWDTSRYVNGFYFTVDDPLVDGNDEMDDIFDLGGYDYSNDVTFCGERFTGGQHVFTIEFSQYAYEYEDKLDYLNMPIMIKLSRLSPELYRYRKTAVSHSPLEQIISEPVQVYSNVDGGMGIFGGSTSKALYLNHADVQHFHYINENYYKASKR